MLRNPVNVFPALKAILTGQENSKNRFFWKYRCVRPIGCTLNMLGLLELQISQISRMGS